MISTGIKLAVLEQRITIGKLRLLFARGLISFDDYKEIEPLVIKRSQANNKI